jgi:hypothetical protein
MVAADSLLSFDGHDGLLRAFIRQREPIVERIQELLNSQQKRPSQPGAPLARQFEDCFFVHAGVTREQAALRGQLQAAHWAEGFRPRDMPGIPNEMFDPADMMTRGLNVWRNTRWPGRNGRSRYANTLFNLYVVRCLTLLSMRVCDVGARGAERLAQLQHLLDALWKSSPVDQPVLVRDVRWLVPVAQSPTTDDLAPYFEAARKIEECLPTADRLEIHRASVLMAGGHLRSQLRHFTMQGRLLDEKSLTLSTRGSNALDCAMTIQHLAPLLAEYEDSVRVGDARRRALAGVICQGISADPELYVNRLDLLGAYSVIEPLFVTVDGGQIALTPVGERHFRLLRQYVELMPRLAQPLYEDCPHFRPLSGAYSPYGVMFGFSSNILEHMTLKALQPEAETAFSLEDVFTDEGSAARLAWVSGWRQLPHVPPEVQKLYAYPQQFAEAVFERILNALKSAALGGLPPASGHLHLGNAGVAALAPEYLLSSDPVIISAGQAKPCDPDRLLADRREGMYLVSYQTAGGWIAVSKDVLTDVLGAHQDVAIPQVPAQAAMKLKMLYPHLVIATPDSLTEPELQGNP